MSDEEKVNKVIELLQSPDLDDYECCIEIEKQLVFIIMREKISVIELENSLSLDQEVNYVFSI